MTILSLETSATTCGAALSTFDGLISEASVFIPNVHDTHLQMVVDNCLAQAGLAIQDVDVCAVNAGPGSFTGLRIGASFAKGLCFDGKIKLLPISSLESSACASQEIAVAIGCRNILATMGSHRNLGFIQKFSSTLEALSDVQQCTLEDAVVIAEQNYVLCGTWATFISHTSTKNLLAISGISRMSPRFVARRASQILSKKTNPFADAILWSPNYYSNTYEQPKTQE